MRVAVRAVVVGASLAWASPAWGQYSCVEAVGVRGGEYDGNAVSALLQMRPRCVRLTMRRDVWSDISDTTRRGPGEDTALGVHRRLIDAYRRGGAEVLLAVGPDVIGASREELRSTTRREQYARAVREVAAYLHGRLLALELVDEPNRLDAAGREALEASDYARLLVEVYSQVEAVRLTYGCWLPRLVVGGLVHDSPPVATRAGDYLDAVYAALEREPRWSLLGPLRVVSAHFLRSSSSLGGGVLGSGALGAVSDITWRLRRRLGADASLPEVWITQVGWRTDGSAEGNRRQADEAFDLGVSLRRATENVPRLVSWYAYVDDGAYGLFDRGVVANSTRRGAYNNIYNLLAAFRPALWSRLEFTVLEVTAVAGQRVPVQLRVSNASANTSPVVYWDASSNLSVGQAEGCPHASEINGVRWVDLPPGSISAPFVLGARVPFVPSPPRPPTSSALVEWNVEAHPDPGEHIVAAQLLQGDRWFGPTATMLIRVVSADAGAHDAPDASIDAAQAEDASELDATSVRDDAPANVIDAPPLASIDVAPRPDDLAPTVDVTPTVDVAPTDDAAPPPNAVASSGCRASASPPARLRFGALILATVVVARRRRPRAASSP